MEFRAQKINVMSDILTDFYTVSFETRDRSILETFEKLKDEKDIKVKAIRWRNRRSINANNYLWELLSQMAPILKTSKDELYLHELQKYGTFLYLPGTDEDMERLRNVFRIVIDRGETILTTPSGKRLKMKQLQCYKGSSLYDTLEMSGLIDGVVSDAQELGIDTATPEELREMKERWNV